MNKILYFPAIELPPTDWTKQAILYWDEIGIIAPEMYTSNFSDDMRFLQREHIIRINYPSFSSGFDEGFLTYTQSYASEHESLIEFETMKSEHLLHFRKLQHLAPKLEALKLANKVHGSDSYQVHPHIARTFMSALAFSISNEKRYHPATDKEHYFAPLTTQSMGELNNSFSPIIQKNNIVRKLLITSLPTPQHLSIPELISFKNKHQEALTKYRCKIDNDAKLIQTRLESGQPIDSLIDDFSRETSEALLILEEELDRRYEYNRLACVGVLSQLPIMLDDPLINLPAFVVALSQVRVKRKISSPFLYSALLNQKL